MSVCAQSVKNGAPLPIHGSGGGLRRPDSTDVRFGRLAVCDLEPLAPGTANWRFRPSKERHLAPLSATFLPIFSEILHQGRKLARMGPRRALVHLSDLEEPTA